MSDLKRLVLDVLKPHNPSIIDVAQQLSILDGISGLNVSIKEVDQETETVKITIKGNSIDYELVEETIREVGAVIHSVDNVSAGKELVDELETQD